MMFRAFEKLILTFDKFGECFGTEEKEPKPIGDRFYN